ncbi:hypothetical protein V2J09_023017 [Rumex salicifolius]
MDPRTPPAAPRRYEIFEPKTDLVQEEAAITLLVYLPEFKVQQLRVQLSSSRVLRMSGERPLGVDDKWMRFVKEIRVPDECDVKGIKVKFDKGVLYVKQSKFVAEKVQNIEEPTKEIVDGNKKINYGRESVDENGKESGEAKLEKCSLKNGGEEIINSPDGVGGLLLTENIGINLRKLLLILVLAFGLVFRILYKGKR